MGWFGPIGDCGCCDEEEECANCDGWSLNFCFCRDPITGLARFKDSIIFDITGTVPGGTSFGYSLGPQALPPVDVAGSYEFFFGPEIGPCTQVNKTYFLHAPVALGEDIFGDYLYAVLLLVNTISSYSNSTTVSLVSAVIRNTGSTELPVPTEDAYAVASPWQSELLNLSTIEVFPCGEDLTCLCREISGLISDLDITGSYGHGLHTGITGNAEYTY